MKLEDLQDLLLEFIEAKGSLKRFTVWDFYGWVRDEHTPVETGKERIKG